MVSGDQRIKPLLAYGNEEPLSAEDVHLPGVELMYEDYGDAVVEMRTGVLDMHTAPEDPIDYAPVPCDPQLNSCRPYEPEPECPWWDEDVDDLVGPLLTTRWGQGCPYNGLLPSKSKCRDDDDCGWARPVSGCITVAMAQVFNFWEGPMGLNFEYNRMLPTYTTSDAHRSRAASPMNVQMLYEFIGNRVSMNYGCENSWAIPDVINGVFRQQGFTNGGDKHDYDWVRVRDDINAGRPVIMQARRTRTSNWHVWVIDGFHTQRINCRSRIWQHMNWGWNGRANDWYTVGQWRPLDNRGNHTGTNYSQFQKTFTNIAP